MITLPAQFNILNLSIQTFGLFLLFGFVLLAFIVWKEGKNDGFDEERLFDLLLLSMLSAVLLSRAFYATNNVTSGRAFFEQIYKVWLPGYNLYGALFGLLIPLFVMCKRWKWSIYRILDIFSLGLSLSLAIIVLGFVGLQGKYEFLFAFSSWIFLFALLSKFRTSKIKSGYAFSLFLLLNALLSMIFFTHNTSLTFYLVLVTLASAVFLFRWRTLNYDRAHIKRIASRVKAKLTRKKD
jgi:hypothetical protein